MKEYFLTNKEECNLPATIGSFGKIKSFLFQEIKLPKLNDVFNNEISWFGKNNK